jgi:hypothetical protein
MLNRIGLEAPEPIESAPSKKLRKKEGLPMPRMPGDSEEMSS